ncbi:hypothetical protein ASPACDRAFT_37827 [Aspergillus aculeatus ATCC 16872]|uniref:Uncharacterized protein n=1 Tax=Aspergillus aculeatus (strain ATCC 16872 / CBS 172.66 / WB 5094) TaxID=690307 RepID=A0A1L9X728_ASPA1|nr:uncharacterized protein ASPACDRAFT_37827 [Aspergillus aculeatus ATCC 16872]OJK04273.1 hypothetical protein ASPACDRAFT_37827 [Aspergillus aculeatus ATCC 16872]
MVRGIIFQLVFVGLVVDFVLRLSKRGRPQALWSNRPLLLLGGATALSLLLIYIRSVYRTIELLHGWTSSTMHNEMLLIGLDGAIMVPAFSVYNLLHPGYLLPKVQREVGYLDARGLQMEMEAVKDGRYQIVEVEGGKDDSVTLLDRS